MLNGFLNLGLPEYNQPIVESLGLLIEHSLKYVDSS